MIFNIYSIYDIKGEFFWTPMHVVNDEVAKRQVEISMLKDENGLMMHAEDYTLRQLGSFDNRNGQITTLDVPKHVADMSSLRSKVMRDTRRLQAEQEIAEG